MNDDVSGAGSAFVFRQGRWTTPPKEDYVNLVGIWYMLAGLDTSAAWIRLSLQLCLALRYSPSGFRTYIQ